MPKSPPVRMTAQRQRELLLDFLRLEYGPDFHPLLRIVEMAEADDSCLTPGERVGAYDKVLPYIMPKLKSTDVSIQSDSGEVFTVNLVGIRDDTSD